MASGSVGVVTDAIPLLDDNGSGVYSKGRNNARDIRIGLLNGIVAPDTSSFLPRQGVLARTYNPSATPLPRWEDLFVRASAVPSRDLVVQAGVCVVTRTGQGPYVLFLESDLTVTLSNADGTNPRIDLVCARLFDKGPFPGDALHGPVIWQEQGVASGTPAVPATPAGSIVLAQIARAAGSPGDQIAAASITDTRKSAGLLGALRPLLPGETLSAAGLYHGERRLRTGTQFVPAGLPLSNLIDYYSSADTAWHGTQPIPYGQPTQTGFGTFPTGSAIIAALTIPDLGFPYRVDAAGGFEYTIALVDALIGAQVTYDSSVWNTNPFAKGLAKNPGASGSSSKFSGTVPGTSPVLAAGASHTIRLLGNNFEATTASVVSGGSYTFKVTVVPV